METKRVRIQVNGPSGIDCRVDDAETGHPIKGCYAFKIESDVAGAATAQIFLRDFAFDGVVDAEVVRAAPDAKPADEGN